ncbi:chitin-binding protein [Cohnella sp. SGD-V74]|nr:MULTISPECIES: lytic polysaccharide monooxygenase [unclassified Cohnella]PRX68736.1 chitin-binding protein [Cohnella sp. SGD-V74]
MTKDQAWAWMSMRTIQGKLLVAMEFLLIAAAALLVVAEKASAHGYVSSPASRAVLCTAGKNKDCGPVIYEPQSLEGKGGFPASGPADGQLASAGVFTSLDAQSDKRWTKVELKGGKNTFSWQFTANHSTKQWRYYITKKGWDPNQPLTRDQLEAEPFCTVDGGNKRPDMQVSHECNVPADRTGYHVILSVWDIADTANAFYQAIDVNLGTGSGGEGESPIELPTAPKSVMCTGQTSGSLTLGWQASSASAGIKEYEVSRDGKVVGTTKQTLYTDNGLGAGTSYSYTIVAVDLAGNRSAASAALIAATLPASGGGNEGGGQPGTGTGTGTWDSSKVYLGGDKVTYNGVEYVASWWTQGDKPDSSDVWKAAAGSGAVQAWNESKAYVGQDKVAYEGKTYQAKWWTRGEVPSKGGVWVLVP